MPRNNFFPYMYNRARNCIQLFRPFYKKMSETEQIMKNENPKDVENPKAEKPRIVKPTINYPKITFNEESFEVKSAGFLVFKIIDGKFFAFMIKEDGKEYFSEPGGKYEEKDETAINCALREFEEETKISIRKYINYNIEPQYIKTAKYNMYPFRVSENFEFEEEHNGKFIEITSEIPLHPRSETFVREFISGQL